MICVCKEMDKHIIDWLNTHKGKTVSSPRNLVFTRAVKDFEIVDIDEMNERVKIHFEESTYPALPLTFSMFERALNYIIQNKGHWVRLGTSIDDPQPGTIEGAIWQKPYPINYKHPYKTASHVCDILALASLVEYGSTINPLTGRRVQAIRLSK